VRDVHYFMMWIDSLTLLLLYITFPLFLVGLGMDACIRHAIAGLAL